MASDAIGDAGRLREHADLRETGEALKQSREAYDSAELAYMLAAHRLAQLQLQPSKRRLFS